MEGERGHTLARRDGAGMEDELERGERILLPGVVEEELETRRLDRLLQLLCGTSRQPALGQMNTHLEEVDESGARAGVGDARILGEHVLVALGSDIGGAGDG